MPAGRLDAHILLGRAADRLFSRLLVLSAAATVVLVLAGVALGVAHRPPRTATTAAGR